MTTGLRAAVSDIRLKFKSVLNFQMDDGWLSALTMGGWIVRERLQTGVDTDQANRAWEYESIIASGDTLDINLFNMDGIDIGGGSGKDGLGQTLAMEEIVSLVIYHVSGTGSLEVMPSDPANKLRWVPSLTVASGGALKAGGAMMMHQPHTDAFDVDGENWQMLRLRALGGDVKFHVYVLARHDDSASSSSLSTSSSTSKSSVSTSSSLSSSSISSSTMSSSCQSLSSTLSSSSSSTSSISSTSSSSSSSTSSHSLSTTSGVLFGEGWERTCSLTIDHDLVDSTLSDFTYILTEATLPSEILDTDSGNACLDGGGDIRFTSDPSGVSRLACDIRACHPTAGGVGCYADIAVKVPSISSEADTSIYIWYKKAGESQPASDSTYGSHNAYDSYYKAVYPLHENPSLTQPQFVDRTHNGYSGSGWGSMTSEDQVDGAVHYAVEFDGSNDYIISSCSKTAVGSTPTVSVLVNSSQSDSTMRGILSFAVQARDEAPWVNFQQTSPTAVRWRLDASYPVSQTITAGEWTHFACKYDGTTWRVYKNGAAGGTYLGNLGSEDGSYLFVATGYSDEWPGKIDEVRISSDDRSDAWIKAEYHNLLDAAAFTTVGTPSSVPQESSSSSSLGMTSTSSFAFTSTMSISSSLSSSSSTLSSTSCSTSMSGGPQYIITGQSAEWEVELNNTYLFTVTLENADELSGSVVITPSASNGDDEFNPASVTLSEASQSAEIEYSPDDWGSRTITFNNDRSLNQKSVTFTALVEKGQTVLRFPTDPDLYDNLNMPKHGGYLPFGSYDPAVPLSIINKDIREDEVDPDSAEILYHYGQYPGIILNFEVGYMLYKGTGYEQPLCHYGMVVNTIEETQTKVPIDYVSWGITEGDHIPMPIPPMASAQSYYTIPVTTWPHPFWAAIEGAHPDQQVLCLSPDNNELYELYRGWTTDGGLSWHANGGAKFDLTTSALRPDSWSSADGAGMPIYPLLLRWDEVERAIDGDGYIPHALRFTVNLGRYWCLWPARHAAGGWDPGVGLGWGERIRLKQSWYDANISKYTDPAARVILNTLLRYGMFMCDYGGSFQVQACMDYGWSSETFYQLHGVYLPTIPTVSPNDFEVLKRTTGCTLTGPSTAQVGIPAGPYTVSRVPITDTNYANSLYLTDGTWWDNTVLSDAHPTHDFYYTAPSAGVKNLYLVQNTCYWRLPPALTVTVT